MSRSRANGRGEERRCGTSGPPRRSANFPVQSASACSPVVARPRRVRASSRKQSVENRSAALCPASALKKAAVTIDVLAVASSRPCGWATSRCGGGRRRRSPSKRRLESTKRVDQTAIERIGARIDTASRKCLHFPSRILRPLRNDAHEGSIRRARALGGQPRARRPISVVTREKAGTLAPRRRVSVTIPRREKRLGGEARRDDADRSAMVGLLADDAMGGSRHVVATARQPPHSPYTRRAAFPAPTARSRDACGPTRARYPQASPRSTTPTTRRLRRAARTMRITCSSAVTRPPNGIGE